jgi:small subunit ribosomal protein S6e
MKLVVSDPKTGKAKQFELSEEQIDYLLGKKIGDEIELSFVGLDGYKAKITGGSDTSGFPMFASVHGTGRKRLLVVAKSGKKKGARVRKTVRGNTIAKDIAQVNVVVIEYGEKPLFEEQTQEENQESQ